MRTHQPQGFTLLYSILVIGALLSIVFSIINITYKQVTLSGTARDSQVAFYMADTGAECAKYWDYKGAFSSDSSNSSGTTITCGGQSIKVGGPNGFTNGVQNGTKSQCPGDIAGSRNCALSIFTLKYSAAGASYQNEVKISLYKNVNTGESILVSSGHNIDDPTNPRQVERSVQLVYTPVNPNSFCSGDVMILVDTSSSVSGNINKLAANAKALIRGLFDEGRNTIHIGIIPFGSSPTMTNDMRLTDYSNEDLLLDKIDQYVSSAVGQTNMQGAFQLAYGELSTPGRSIAPKNRQPNYASFDDIRSDYESQESNSEKYTYDNRNDNREDTNYPNYVFILTDGAPNLQIVKNQSGIGSNQWATPSDCSAAAPTSEATAYASTKCYFTNANDAGSVQNLNQAEAFANQLKNSAGATIYAIGIGFKNNYTSETCNGSPCSDFMTNRIVGAAGMSSAEKKNYYFDADNFETEATGNNLGNVIKRITTQCE